MKNLVLLFSFITTTCFASKIKPFAELSCSFYAPYPTIKFDLNGGVMFSNYKVQHYVSVGIGYNFSPVYSYNIKETMVFKKEVLNYFQPLVSLQFKYNNQRQYNTLDGTSENSGLYNKISFISTLGLQKEIKSFKLQIQTGIAYNTNKIEDDFEKFYNKMHNDVNFNTITNISIIKVF